MINGLAIINDKPNLGYSAHTQPPGGLPNHYRQNVIGGPNAFLLVVENFNSFADAMAQSSPRNSMSRQRGSSRPRLCATLNLDCHVTEVGDICQTLFVEARRLWHM